MHHVTPSHRPRLTGLDAARGLAVLGMFAAHVGAAHTAFDWSDPSVVLPLSAVGRVALTLSCAHVLVIGVWSRSGEPDPLPALGGWGPFVVLLVAAVVVASLVRRSGRRGPLEALTRRTARALDDPPTTAP